MSKIKDLLAEEENIDDLKAPRKYGLDFVKSVQEIDNKRMAEHIFESSKTAEVETWFSDNANFALCDDGNYEPYMVFTNYEDLCEERASRVLDTMIEEQHLDISDAEYSDIVGLAAQQLELYYAEYGNRLCNDALNDWKVDNKYKLEELAERNGQC